MVKLKRSVIRRVIAGVDWGFTNPGVILVGAMDYDGRLFIVHEVKRARQLIEWWVDVAARLHAAYGIEAFVCDPSEPAYIAQFQQRGLNAVRADNSVRAGIQDVQTRMKKAADGLPRLFIFRDALEEPDPMLVEKRAPVSLAAEIPGYIWQPPTIGRAAKEEPVKVDDHSCDALRYLVRYIDQSDNQLVVGSAPAALSDFFGA
jgi:phage terminase large subunit